MGLQVRVRVPLGVVLGPHQPQPRGRPLGVSVQVQSLTRQSSAHTTNRQPHGGRPEGTQVLGTTQRTTSLAQGSGGAAGQQFSLCRLGFEGTDLYPPPAG